jgi:hypothetical protein
MISIRECIAKEDLVSISNKHVDCVSKEVHKRILFFKGLFETIQYLQTHQGTHISTIKTRVNNHIHHTQFIPFIRCIFEVRKNFKTYNDIKKTQLFLLKARDITLVISSLIELQKRSKSILALDLSLGSGASKVFYARCKVLFEPIDFLLSKIFDYDWLIDRSADDDWSAYALTTALGLRVCSYCNRQYTFTLSKGKSKITKPELDHFLPQNEHPLLRLSFFNLIPSCTICNRDCKGQESFNYEDYHSPYEINSKHGLLAYNYFPKSYLGSIGESDDIKIYLTTPGLGVNPALLKKLEGNLKIFEYNVIANEHRDIVQEIIRKRHISNDTYIETIQNMFSEVGLEKNEAYRLAYGNFYKESEFSKRPLAKLTKDIAIGVGALKISNK